MIIERKIKVDSDFPYHVFWIYPIELKNEKILKNSIDRSYEILKELVRYQDQLKIDKNCLSYMYFDSQIFK
jgi:hypothetical protein